MLLGCDDMPQNPDMELASCVHACARRLQQGLYLLRLYLLRGQAGCLERRNVDPLLWLLLLLLWCVPGAPLLLLSAQDMPALCQEKAVIQAIMHSMAQEGKAAQLRGFEQVSAVTLVPEPFTVENGLLTPTFKLKRPQAKAAYEALIVNMYESISSGNSSSLAGVGAGGAGSMAGRGQ